MRTATVLVQLWIHDVKSCGGCALALNMHHPGRQVSLIITGSSAALHSVLGSFAVLSDTYSVNQHLVIGFVVPMLRGAARSMLCHAVQDKDGSRSSSAVVGNSYTVNLAKVPSLKLTSATAVRDMTFMHGFTEPLLVLLHETVPTWGARYKLLCLMRLLPHCCAGLVCNIGIVGKG